MEIDYNKLESAPTGIKAMQELIDKAKSNPDSKRALKIALYQRKKR